ncbi:hypothetical protein RHOER0001_5505 [Rhodococcus erythropolis SK121]|nr:hypothetical protein RHOER0001_5505 [Rhodococcus erythropolis SK121]
MSAPTAALASGPTMRYSVGLSSLPGQREIVGKLAGSVICDVRGAYEAH